jgi:O-acetyl-ADP-ribose deacetylase (regulator of RNase III)
VIKLIHSGDIFDSTAQTLTNPVNCVGVMGAGLALSFAKEYPDMLVSYQKACSQHAVRTGRPYVYPVSKDKQVLLFPTKNDWRNPSRLGFIQEGLKYLAFGYKILNITSLAIPSLGCGLGGLPLPSVLPMIYQYLGSIDIPVEVYLPYT